MTALNRIGPKSNAFTFSFDEKLLDDIRDSYNNFILPGLESPEHISLYDGGAQREGTLGRDDHQYYYTTFGEEPLIWISNNNWRTYTQFKNFFDALNIKDEVKQLVDYDKDLTFYSGFFVVGNRARDTFWHMDYSPGANAYTFISPLFPPDPGHGNLAYKDPDDNPQTHIYNLGEGIVLGENFLHATEPYPQCETPRVLLSFTFGTDKLEHWEALEKTIAGQSEFMVLPCGHQLGRCQCLEEFNAGGDAAIIEPASRNAPCPCGSGKRYKHCHGN